MKSLTERLREQSRQEISASAAHLLCHAADEIDRLQSARRRRKARDNDA